ncbi:MAG: PIN domain-containing protein [Alphaproteobacteria bacterium]
MIAADASTLSALLFGEAGRDVDLLASEMAQGGLRLPPVVLTEILTDTKVAALLAPKLDDLELLAITDGYWQRAGTTRSKLKSRGLKANVADTLIAQSCIDHDVALITRDGDFKHFAKHCGLKLA